MKHRDVVRRSRRPVPLTHAYVEGTYDGRYVRTSAMDGSHRK